MSMTLADYAPVYSNCRYCLMCRHVCPVGRATQREATTPHGWGLLIASVDRGQMKWDAEAVDTLYQCAQCGLCHANCVTDQPLPLAIAAARAEVVRAGVAPTAVSELEAKLRQWGNPYREIEPLASTGTASTALFIGAAHHLHPTTVAAARRLLDTLGIEHTAVAVGLSSAALPYALGLRETARTLTQAAHHDIVAAHCQRVIVFTPADALTLREIHPDLGVPLPDGVEVVELTTLLAEAMEAGRLRVRATAQALTYHDPVATPRLLARAKSARRILTALSTQPLRELFWREGRAAPDGATGGLMFTHPALAAQLSRERLAEAAATGANLLVTEDPAALAHLELCMDGAGIKVAGLYELIAEQLIP